MNYLTIAVQLLSILPGLVSQLEKDYEDYKAHPLVSDKITAIQNGADQLATAATKLTATHQTTRDTDNG